MCVKCYPVLGKNVAQFMCWGVVQNISVVATEVAQMSQHVLK